MNETTPLDDPLAARVRQLVDHTCTLQQIQHQTCIPCDLHFHHPNAETLLCDQCDHIDQTTSYCQSCDHATELLDELQHLMELSQLFLELDDDKTLLMRYIDALRARLRRA